MSTVGRAASAIGLAALAAIVGVVVMTGGDRSPAAPADHAAEATVPSPREVAPPPTTVPPPDLPDRGVHPELVNVERWLQGDVHSLEELRGQVVAVQFWTFACRNCRNTLEHMQDLYATHRDEGFEIVGIHAPEFEFEADVDNIVEAAGELGVTWPIALDPTKRTFHSWQDGPRGHWPRIYLIDRNGHVRYDHIGEGRYDEIAAAVRALLAEPV